MTAFGEALAGTEAPTLAEKRALNERYGSLEATLHDGEASSDALDGVELGPLRDSGMTSEERQALPPSWVWLDHGPLPYVTRADHRTVGGKIVSRGTRCLAVRAGGVLLLKTELGNIYLDGCHHCLNIPEAPRLPEGSVPEYQSA